MLQGRRILCCFRLLKCQDVRYNHRLTVTKIFPIPDLTDNRPKTAKSDGTEPATSQDQSPVSTKLMTQQKLILGASSGTFYLLPSITRALEKLYRIIDHEMRSIGAQKITMPCLAPDHLWKASGRWERMGSELFTLIDRSKTSHCLAPTHEEAVTSIVASESPVSYKRLPIRLYQIGRKFRDERRPKHGLLRCREFEMKDLYTFDADSEGAEESFRQVCEAYTRIFSRLGLSFVAVDASTGLMGGKRSCEFHLESAVGEDRLFVCDRCGKGANQELLSEQGQEGRKCTADQCTGSLQPKSGIEIAHAFILGTTYTDAFKATYIDSNRDKRSLQMGCYGIGVTRLLSASIEVLSAENQLRWCRLLAPHQVSVIPQKEGYKSDVTWGLAESIYDRLAVFPNLRSEVVIDDRLSLSIGQRIKYADSLGFPYAVVIGKQALSDPPIIEFHNLYESTKQLCSMDQVVDILNKVETVTL